ncbi:MAG: hypothetical protein ACYCXP_13420 [Leptospirillum sp.]
MKPLGQFKSKRDSVQSFCGNAFKEGNKYDRFSTGSRLYAAMVFLSLALAACGGGSGGGGVSGVSSGTSSISGVVQGGGTAIVGSKVTLYSANGAGVAPTVLGYDDQTDSNGKYKFGFTPPSSGHLLYVVATGGVTSPGASPNSNINLMNIVGVSAPGFSPPPAVAVNEATTVVVAYEAQKVGANLTTTSISGTSTAFTTLYNNVSGDIDLSTGQIPLNTNLNSTVLNNVIDPLANGYETCVNNASLCAATTPPTLTEVETALSDYVASSSTALISTIGSTSGSYTAPTASTGSGTLLGILVTATLNSSNNATLETYPFTEAGTIPSSAPTTTLPIASGQIPTGGGFDSSFNVYAVVTVNSTDTSATVTLYNFDPTNGFGTAINSQTMTASSGNTCSGGGSINPSVHFVGLFCSGTASPQICLYSYNASGLQSCIQPTIPSSVNTNNIRGDNQLNFLWLRSRTSTSSSTSYSYSGVFQPTYSQSSITFGSETTFGPVNFSVPSPNATDFGVDNNYGLIFYSAYCSSSSCSSEPLDVLSFNTSTGVVGSSVNSSQTLTGGNIVNATLSSNSGDYSSVDSTDQLFFMENFSSGISIIPYSYNSSGTVTALTALSLSSVSSPNGNSDATIDPNSHFIFLPEGSSSTATGIETILYNNSGITSEVSSPISLPSGQLVPSCSSSCNNVPNFIFDAVN